MNNEKKNINSKKDESKKVENNEKKTDNVKKVELKKISKNNKVKLSKKISDAKAFKNDVKSELKDNNGSKSFIKKESELGKVTIDPKLQAELIDKDVAEIKKNEINKNSSVKKGFVGILVVVFIFVLFCVVAKINDNNKEKVLNNKVNQLASMNSINTDFNNVDVSGNGTYQVIADTVKEFLIKYSNVMKKIQVDLQEEQAIANTMLVEENYKNDAPNFVNSLNAVNDAKARFDADIEEYNNLVSQHSIMKLIEDKKVSAEYVELYRNYFFSESMLREKILKDSSTILSTKNTVDNTYTGIINIFNFLVTNAGKWEINNGKVIFNDFGLTAQFTALKVSL